jgi:phenylacetate-CoA ligase
MFTIAPINDFKCEAVQVGGVDALRVSVEIKRDATVGDAITLLEREIKRVFEVTPSVVVLEPGTLAREFESTIKAPRIRDLRPT